MRTRLAGTELDVVDLSGLGDLGALPRTVRILLEGVARHADGDEQAAAAVERLAAWNPADPPSEVPFRPTRILLQDFTGVPVIADLAALRDAVAERGGDAAAVAPSIPVDLVIDHSITAEVARRPDALQINQRIEYQRNEERYRFLRWGQQAFGGVSVFPPGAGICHQVNLEHLAKVAVVDGGLVVADTVLGTDSHTPMVNGLGVLGWGVGGIEAEAAMLGVPNVLGGVRVVALHLTGALREGITATDLVLTVTEALRAKGVVGSFVEAVGDGVAHLRVEDRATIANMSPEFGSTATLFPVDDAVLRYLRATGRDDDHIAVVEAHAKHQGLWGGDGDAPLESYADVVHVDLGAVEPSMAGPSRPQDRVPIQHLGRRFREALGLDAPPPKTRVDHGSAMSFPASDPPSSMAAALPRPGNGIPHEHTPLAEPDGNGVPVELDGERFELRDGHVAIAAITSCTNTSNPSVMVGAGLLAKKAVERGLTVPPWVKTSLAPGSPVVVDYLEKAGLLEPLAKLGFHLVGFGCTTCIGNSGPLAPPIAEAIREHRLSVASVLSGNRNFEGRIHPDVRMNFLASPPLVVAAAIAGTVDIDLANDELAPGVRLADIWPTAAEIEEALSAAVGPDTYRARYATAKEGDEQWRSLAGAEGQRYGWEDTSTYLRRPPFLDDDAIPEVGDVEGARALLVLGDSITTDHISPAGVIRPGTPAAAWLEEHGVDPADFSSYGARRGNHEVMMRGTFANPRIRNQLVPGVEGGVSVHLPSGEQGSVYDVSRRYAADGTPLVVLAGNDYGAGSSRDWAAKGTALLGVRAVIAESFERIHRSNLVGMGVVPLQFLEGESVTSLGLTGQETFAIRGLDAIREGRIPERVTVEADGRTFEVLVKAAGASELAQLQAGGILPLVLRSYLGGG